MSRVIAIAALLAGMLAVGHAGAADRLPGEVVHFPSGDATVTLDGRLLRPDGPGPFPAVVALHGCGGLYRRDGTEVFARDRVGLVGWSHGGGTALATQGNPPQADYRAAVSFYPGCRRALKTIGWKPQAPLLLIVGEADDWTPAGPCRVLAARLDLDGALELVTYPGATHDFDAPGSTTMRTMTGIPSVKGGTVHMATDPAARDDAIARVTRFLARWLKDEG